MTHSAEPIRKLLRISETEKARVLTIEVKVYDSGRVTVNGRPVDYGDDPLDAPGTWLGAVEIANAIITSFFRDVIRKSWGK